MVVLNGCRDDKLFAVHMEDDGCPMEECELIDIAYAVWRGICDHLVLIQYRVDEGKLYTVPLDHFSKTPEAGEAMKGITLKMTGDSSVVIMRGSTVAGFATWRGGTTFVNPAVDMVLLEEFLQD